MQWDKYTIETTTAAEDIVASALFDLGIEGVQIENHVALSEEEIGDMFIDFPLDMGDDDGTSRVIFYLESGMAKDEKKLLLANAAEALAALSSTTDIGEGRITSEVTDDADWLNNWKQFFQSFSIGEIYIRPSWEEPDARAEGKILIEIDPGISFGTGKHETTYMCIEALQRCLQDVGERRVQVLDVGCGSGILSVAALKLGAEQVLGLDIDENCIASSCENAQKNGLDSACYSFIRKNLLDDADARTMEGQQYDLIAANILADVLVPMMPRFQGLLREGGRMILSGIIDFKEQEVLGALRENGFLAVQVARMGEWVCITAERR